MTREPEQGHPAGSSAPVVATIPETTASEAPPPQTRMDVDGALLVEAGQLLGTHSELETINRALADLIRQGRRQQAAEAQIRRFQAGEFAQVLHAPRRRP